MSAGDLSRRCFFLLTFLCSRSLSLSAEPLELLDAAAFFFRFFLLSFFRLSFSPRVFSFLLDFSAFAAALASFEDVRCLL